MRATAACLAVVLTLSSFQANAADTSIVGTWYGEGEPNDGFEIWLAHIAPDGSFRIFFRKCIGQKPTITEMDGRWKVTGTLMEMFVDKWDGEPRSYRDGYQILSNNGRTLRYKFTESDTAPASFIGHIFQSSKVPEKFEIPGCDIVS